MVEGRFPGFSAHRKLRLNAWDVDLRRVNRFAYFYAATANLAATWSGTGNGWLSVNPQAAFDKCAFEDPGNGLWVDFNELDFTWADAGWDFVVTFWYWEGTYGYNTVSSSAGRMTAWPSKRVRSDRGNPLG